MKNSSVEPRRRFWANSKSREEVKGEITLLIGRAPEHQRGESVFNAHTVRTRVRELMKAESLDERDALKRVAKEMGVSKSVRLPRDAEDQKLNFHELEWSCTIFHPSCGNLRSTSVNIPCISLPSGIFRCQLPAYKRALFAQGRQCVDA